MCRLYGFLANEKTKVECTLVHAQNALLHQSRGDSKGHAHPDGWGISCYPDGAPVRERRATAAHSDIWFSATAERTYSHAVVAHIRRATISSPSAENTHPFLCGRWTFAHNGTLANFDRVEGELDAETGSAFRRMREGETDSELIFLWLLTQLTDAGIHLEDPTVPFRDLAPCISAAIIQLGARSGEGPTGQPSQLNFILTDGRSLLATRWNHTLYYVERQGVHDCEICGIPHIRHDAHKDYRACVTASEPISADERWTPLDNRTMLIADSELNVRILPICS